MTKLILVLSFMIILPLISLQAHSNNAQLKEFEELVKKSQIGIDPYIQIESEAKGLKVDAGKNMYTNSEEAIKALTLLRNFPLPPKSTLRAYEIMENGLAESLPTISEKKEFLEVMHKLRYRKSIPYMSASRRLLNSTVYLDLNQKVELSKAILTQAKNNLAQSGTLLDVMVQLVVINEAISKKILKTDADSVRAFEALRLEGKALSSSLGEEANKVNAKDATVDRIKNLPDKTVEGLAHINSKEFKEVKNLRTKINPLLKNLSAL